MKSVRPKPFDMHALRLSAEEGFVLSRIDGPLSLKELVALTGLEESRVHEIVTRLVEQGAVEAEPESVSESESESESASESDSDSESESESESDSQSDSEPDSESESESESASDDHLRVLEGERAYRKIYEALFRAMERDGRAAAAAHAEGSQLLALCLDADPLVIHALLTNPRAALEHARAIAFHHRTPAGLEMCARRSEFLSDAMVQRRMLRNPQLPDTILTKIIQPKQLLDSYRIAIDREIPERSRVKSRELLRKKYMLCSADERAALLIKTEGRALILLVNCPLDAHTAQILCGKTTYTILFVQNLARFSATPPQLLVHLLKQQLVRRNQGLRKMLLQHHNTPSEAKKAFF